MAFRIGRFSRRLEFDLFWAAQDDSGGSGNASYGSMYARILQLLIYTNRSSIMAPTWLLFALGG